MIHTVTTIVKWIDILMALFWPLIYAYTWGYLIYYHIRYKAKITELEEFREKWEPIMKSWLASNKLEEI